MIRRLSYRRRWADLTGDERVALVECCRAKVKSDGSCAGELRSLATWRESDRRTAAKRRRLRNRFLAWREVRK